MKVKLLVTLLLLLATVSMCFGQALDRTHINYRNPLAHGADCTSTTLNAAITAINAGSDNETVVLTRTDRAKVACTWTFTGAVTTSSKVTLIVPAGVQINAAGFTLTLNGPFFAEKNVFTATSTVVFGPGSVEYVNPMWWGSTMNHTTINNALTATGSANLSFIFGVGTWTPTGSLTIPSRITSHFTSGALLDCNSQTIAINGPILAGGHPIFTNCASGLTVAYGINMLWFGTDSTAFNAGLASTGKYVYIPSGTYNLSAALTVPNANTDIYGDGYATSLVFGISTGIGINVNVARVQIRKLRISGTMGTGIRVQSNGDFAVIDSVDISGAVGGSTVCQSGIGICIDTADDVTISNNTFSGNGDNAGNGGDIVQFNDGDRQQIINNRCMSTTAGYGIQLADTNYSLIQGNVVNSKVKTAGDVGGYGITIYNVAGEGGHNQIIGNRIYDTQGTGIYLLRDPYVVVKGNVLENIAATQVDGTLAVGGIVAVGDTPAEATNCNITGNIVRNSGRHGIRFGGTLCTITGNIVDVTGNLRSGIHAQSAVDNSVISGNTIRGTNGAGINVTTTASGVVVADNNIDTLAATTSANGIILNTCTDCIVSGNRVNKAGARGIYTLGQRITIANNVIIDSGTQATNTFEGIRNEGKRVTIIGNYSGNAYTVPGDMCPATGQSIGIFTNGNFTSVTNNTTLCNITAGLSISGTDTTRQGNRVSEGATQGTATLVAGQATVSTTEVLAVSKIILTRLDAIGAPLGFLEATAIGAGTGFTIRSVTQADAAVVETLDVSTVNWEIVH